MMPDLDFSQFHPLDHNILECRGYPGGWPRHIQYRWEFFVRPWLRVKWRHATGRHAWIVLGKPKGEPTFPPRPEYMTFQVVCEGCDARPDRETRARLILEQWGPSAS